MTTIVRAKLVHTPRNPFVHASALEAFEDGGLAFEDGRILACGRFSELAARWPGASVVDASDALLLPGLVDCHVHYPQIGVIGAMGLELLAWLRRCALPEEARLADEVHAAEVAVRFVRALAANGTTTALVFGSHFPRAQEALFAAAAASGLRIASGLVVSDRGLVPELETTVEEAFEHSYALMRRWHGRGRLRYAVSPRFAVSCSPEMLSACGELAHAGDGVLVTSHLNESPGEVALVGELFPDERDYLAVYERPGLVGGRSVFAHDLHVSAEELRRLAAAGASIAHCASSNAGLGSGVFSLARHHAAGVHVALGTDVGAGAGPSLLGEGLAAYHMQRLAPDGVLFGPVELLWLSTAAGALALGLGEEVGDLSPGKRADFILVRPRPGSTLATVLAGSESIEAMLGAVFTLAREESIAEVRVEGRVVWPAP